MTSANGYVLEVDGYELRASWPAPYFALIRDDANDPSEPILIHCESLKHADACGGIVLNARFERVSGMERFVREQIENSNSLSSHVGGGYRSTF